MIPPTRHILKAPESSKNTPGTNEHTKNTDFDSAGRISRVRKGIVSRLEMCAQRVASNRISPTVAADTLNELCGTLRMILAYQEDLSPQETSRCFKNRTLAIIRALKIASTLTKLYPTFNSTKTKNLVDLFNILGMHIGGLVIVGEDDDIAQLSRARIGFVGTFLKTLKDDKTSVALYDVLRTLKFTDPKCGCIACVSDS